MTARDLTEKKSESYEPLGTKRQKKDYSRARNYLALRLVIPARGAAAWVLPHGRTYPFHASTHLHYCTHAGTHTHMHASERMDRPRAHLIGLPARAVTVFPVLGTGWRIFRVAGLSGMRSDMPVWKMGITTGATGACAIIFPTPHLRRPCVSRPRPSGRPPREPSCSQCPSACRRRCLRRTTR